MIDIDIGHENVTQRCYIIYPPQEVNMYYRPAANFQCQAQPNSLLLSSRTLTGTSKDSKLIRQNYICKIYK